MANLVQLSNELEYVPKEQLAQMSQDPNSRFPSYLVLSEIQRRTANEKAYAAAQPQPTTTVAEEVVGEFMQPKGLQAGMPSESAPTDVFSSEPMGIPASAPMQQPMPMASGGLTGYAVGGPAMSPLQASFRGLGDSIYDRYTDEDGFDYSQALTDAGSAALFASMFTPVGALRAAGMAGLRGLGAINPFSATARTKALQGLGRQTARRFPNMQRTPTGQFRSQRDIGADALSKVTRPAGILGGIGLLQSMEMDDIQMPEEEERELTQAEKDYQKLMQDIQLANLKASQEDTKKGLGGAFSPTDLIQLGGTIMGAKNISELGQGIATVAGASADRKTAAERAGLEAKYLQAQTGKLEEETRLLPERQLTSQIDAVVKAIKQAEESGTDDARLQELRTYLQYLIASQAQTQGYNPQAMSGTNQSLIASYT
jgi:hypothetical protein